MSVASKICDLILVDKNWSPLGIYLVGNDDVRAQKEPGKVLGESKESVEGGIFVLVFGDVYGAP